MRTLSRGILIIAVLAGLSSSIPVLEAQKDTKSETPNLTGGWTMTVEGSPHGTTTMTLVLEQSGKKIGGTFASPHGDMPIEGEFVDGTLTFATTARGGENAQISFKAKLKDHDTLTGFLSSQMGDMTWTAERVRTAK